MFAGHLAKASGIGLENIIFGAGVPPGTESVSEGVNFEDD